MVRRRRMVRRYADRPVDPAVARRGRSTTPPGRRAPGSPRASSCWCSTSRTQVARFWEVTADAGRRQRVAERDADRAGGRRTAHQPGGLPRPVRRARQGLDRPRPGPLAGALLVRRRGHGRAAAAADRGRRGARRLLLRHPAGAGRRRSAPRSGSRPTGCPWVRSPSATGLDGHRRRRLAVASASSAGGRAGPPRPVGRPWSRIRDSVTRAPGCRGGPVGRWTGAMGFEEMWHELAPVGRSSASGGYFRQPWTGAEGELRAWFAEAAEARGLRLETDGARQPGRLVGRRRRARRCSPAPTSTASSTAARTTARWASSPGWPRSTCCASAGSCRRGRSGSRCSSRRRARASGSPASARGWRPGTLDWARRARAARPRRHLPARRAGGRRARGGRPRWDELDRVGCFVELHVEQGRDLVDRGAAVGVGERDLAARALPVRLHRRGQPRRDHADGGPARPDADATR